MLLGPSNNEEPMELGSSDSSFDLESIVGKKVQFKIMLDWDLKFPQGTFVRLLHTGQGQITYLVELDSPIIFEPHKTGFRLRKRPPVSTRQLVILFQRPKVIEKELHGEVEGEFRVPILLYLLEGDSAPTTAMNFVRSDKALGPAWVQIIE
jgi:hypothetical protein